MRAFARVYVFVCASVSVCVRLRTYTYEFLCKCGRNLRAFARVHVGQRVREFALVCVRLKAYVCVCVVRVDACARPCVGGRVSAREFSFFRWCAAMPGY